MQVFPVSSLTRRPRHLGVWPKRLVARAPYVHEGRTLHVVDVENLCGGPDRIPYATHTVAKEYQELAGITPGDHMLVGANPNSLVYCYDAFPGSHLVGEHGPDGADRALLDAIGNVEWLAARFDQVIIGSGDHCFAPIAVELTYRGILVGVVAREGSIARSLEQSVGFVRLLSECRDLEVVA